MKKSAKKILFISIIILFLILSYRFLPVLPFNPRMHDGSGDHNLLKVSIMDKSHADRICGTLSRYGEIYIRAGDKTILITPKLFMDIELIWNYSNKSEI